MINVLFFGQLREQLGQAQLTLNEAPPTVAALREYLAREFADKASQLAAGKALVAVNQTMSDELAPLAAGDEVALFPPVTGG